MESEKIETRIAILIYLPKEISSVIQKVKDQTGVSYPNHETSIPHITLYSCKFEESKFQELIEHLRKLEFKKFSTKLSTFSVIENTKNSNLFASIGFENKEAIQKLHEEVLRIGNELRGNLVREKDVERFKKGIYSPEKFALIKEYGYEYVREHFDPHITIGEVDKSDAEKIGKLKELLEGIEGEKINIDKISILLSQRTIPGEKKVKESQEVEISLVAQIPSI